MKTTLTAVSAIALLAFIAPATAADIYSPGGMKDTVVVSGPVNWTGFYLGVNGGYGENVDSRDSTLNFTSPQITDLVVGVPVKGADPTGFLFGGQIGYLYQPVGSSFVFGGEFAFDGSNITGDTTASPETIFINGAPQNIGMTGLTTTMHQQLDWVGALTGVAGVTMGNAMIYGKAGLAFGQVQESVGLGFEGMNLLSIARTSTDTGWTAGAGVAYKFTPNWSFALEVDYYDLGEHSLHKSMNFGGNEEPFVINADTTHIPENFWAAKAAINYQVSSVYVPLK